MTAEEFLRGVQEFAASPHGREVSSSGFLDWVLVGLAVVSVVLAFLLCLRFFLRPGESPPGHIKREVLRDTPSR